MSQADSLERLMLEFINDERTARGLPPLQLELRLNDSAEDHSEWMLQTDTFSHTGAGGSSADDRMRAANFEFSGNWTWGENIALQSERGAAGLEDDVAALHESLMNSPGHRANILNPDFEVIGIGIEFGEYRGYQAVIVTQNFAATDAPVQIDSGSGSTPPPPPPPEPDPALDLVGTTGNDWLAGQAGDDSISGRAGHDTLAGGDGNDDILGGTGNDVIRGNGHSDRIEGGDGHDLIWGDELQPDPTWDPAGDHAADSIDGGTGNDWILAGEDADVVSGGDGDDRIWGQRGEDWLDGGADDDKVWGGNSRDDIYGNDGNDFLKGEAGSDRISGGNGRDTIGGGDHDDILSGKGGDDFIGGDAGNDYLEGNAGSDVLWGGTGNDVMLGGFDGDVLWGDYGNDVLLGGDGNDNLFGNRGSDSLIADGGSDVLWGGVVEGDEFVFGHSVINTAGNQSDRPGFDWGNVVKGFSTANGDMLVFHTAYQPDELSAALVNGDDIMIKAWDDESGQGGSVIVEDLYATLGLAGTSQGPQPGDPDFEQALMDYLFDYDQVNAGREIIRFGDTAVRLEDSDVPSVEVWDI